jgi:hypothetical protein
LQSKNVPIDEDMRKPELNQLLKENKERVPIAWKLPENMGMKYTSLPLSL